MCFEKMVGIVVMLALLLFGGARAWAQEVEAWERGISDFLEEGYWGSIYEREFKAERRAPPSLFAEKRAPLSLFLDVKEEYDDNIFSTAEDRSRGLITSITPGVRVRSSGLRHEASLDYRLRVTRYANVDPAPGVDLKGLDYLGHSLSLGVKRMIADNFKIGIEEQFLLSRRPADMYLATNRISAAEYWRNWFSPYLAYQLSERTALGLRLRLDTLRYRESFTPADEDSASYGGEFTLGHWMNPRTWFFADFRGFSRDYDWSEGYKANQFLLGVRSSFNPTFRGEFSLGYQKRDFSREIEGMVEDRGEFLGLARLIRETEKSEVELIYFHHPIDIGEGGAYYTIDRTSLTLFYLLLPTVKVAASLFYERVSYDHERVFTEGGKLEKRSDDLYGGDILLEFNIKKWLYLSLGYTGMGRDSNLWQGDYKKNQVFFSLRSVMELWKE